MDATDRADWPTLSGTTDEKGMIRSGRLSPGWYVPNTGASSWSPLGRFLREETLAIGGRGLAVKANETTRATLQLAAKPEPALVRLLKPEGALDEQAARAYLLNGQSSGYRYLDINGNLPIEVDHAGLWQVRFQRGDTGEDYQLHRRSWGASVTRRCRICCPGSRR